MKSSMRAMMIPICILGVLVGRILDRILTERFGVDGTNAVIYIVCFIMFCLVLFLVIVKKHMVAIFLMLMSVPVIIMGIGQYLEIDLYGIGILSFFIIYPILIKVIPRFRDKL